VGRRRDLIRLPRQSATGLVPQSRRCAGCGSAGEHEQQSGVKAHCKASSAGGPAGSRQGPACAEPSQICRRRPANVTSTPQTSRHPKLAGPLVHSSSQDPDRNSPNEWIALLTTKVDTCAPVVPRHLHESWPQREATKSRPRAEFQFLRYEART